MAYGAIQAIKDAGLSIPGDVSLIGFDDDLLSRYTNPPLTTVTNPRRGWARRLRVFSLACSKAGLLPLPDSSCPWRSPFGGAAGRGQRLRPTPRRAGPATPGKRR